MTEETTPDRDAPVPLPSGLAYQLVLIVVSIYALLAMVAIDLAPVSGPVRHLLEYLDLAMCVLFLADFIYCFVRAENRVRYFFTWGWLDLISSIPAVGALRYGRLARVLRIVRVLRALKATRILTAFILQRRRQTAVATVVVVAFSMVIFASLTVLTFEPGKGGHIDSAADALWWAICTVATVGYGDVVPVTFEGRLIAVVLMTAGVALFATAAGLIASWLVEGGESATHAQIRRLNAAMSELKTVVESLKKGS